MSQMLQLLVLCGTMLLQTSASPSPSDDHAICYLPISGGTEACVYHAVTGYNCTGVNPNLGNSTRCSTYGACYISLGEQTDVCYYLHQYGFQCYFPYDTKIISGLKNCDVLKTNVAPEIRFATPYDVASTVQTDEDQITSLGFVKITDPDAKDSEQDGQGYLLVQISTTLGTIGFDPYQTYNPLVLPAEIISILDPNTPIERRASFIPGRTNSSSPGNYSSEQWFTIRTSYMTALMNSLVFKPLPNWNTNLNRALPRVTVNVDDQGNTGGNPERAPTKSITISCSPVNDKPTVRFPADIRGFIKEDTRLIFRVNDIKIDDVDVDESVDKQLTVTVSANEGSFTLSSAPSIGVIIGAHSITATSTVDNLQTIVLNRLIYNPTLNYNGPETITIQVKDRGNTGQGGERTETVSLPVWIKAVNDPPYFVTLPPNGYTAIEDLKFDVPAGTIVMGDPDDIRTTIYIAVHNGTITATPNNYTGAGRSILRKNILISEANAIFNSLQYMPDPNFFGSDEIYIELTDKNQTSSNISIPLNVQAVNDPPIIRFRCTAPAKCNPLNGALHWNANISAPLNTYVEFQSSANMPAIYIEDVDAFDEDIQLLISCENGQFQLSHDSINQHFLTGVRYTIPAAYTGPSVTFLLIGSLKNLNRALNDNGAGFKYMHLTREVDTVIVAVNDLTHTGTGGAGTDFQELRVLPL